MYGLRTTAAPVVGEPDIPQNIILRRKGKIWASGSQGHPELIAQLTAEVKQLSVANQQTNDE